MKNHNKPIKINIINLKNMKKIFLILFLTVAAFTQTGAQVFWGVGYVHTEFDFSSQQSDETLVGGGIGLLLMIEKDINLSESGRWKIHPNFSVSFLWNINILSSIIFPSSRANVISLSPKVSYEVISKEKIKVAPYAGSFVNFATGHQTETLLFEEERIRQFHGGIEWGVRVDLALRKTTLRFIPLGFQSGGSGYFQGMICLMSRI